MAALESFRGKAVVWLLLYSLSSSICQYIHGNSKIVRGCRGPARFRETRGEWMDSVANIVLYLPFGLAAYRCFGSIFAVGLAGAFLLRLHGVRADVRRPRQQCARSAVQYLGRFSWGWDCVGGAVSVSEQDADPNVGGLIPPK